MRSYQYRSFSFAVMLLAWASGSNAHAENLMGVVGFFQGLKGLEVHSLIADSDGSIVLAGTATAAGLPVTTGAFQPGYRAAGCGISSSGPVNVVMPCGDLYVARLGPHGEVLFGSYLGGSSDDNLITAALDASGRIYLLGRSSSNDFPLPLANPGTQPPTRTGGFLIQLNRDASLGFARAIPLNEGMTPAAIVVANNSIYVAGTAFAGSLTTTPGALQPQAGGFDAFAMRIDLSSGSVLYSTYLGGSKQDSLSGFTVDPSGNAILAGSTQSQDFPVTAGSWNAVAPPTPLQNSVFVSVIDPSGARLLASSRFGGEASDSVSQLALASNGDILVAGSTFSRQFPVMPGGLPYVNLGFSAAFLVRLPPDLSSPVFATLLDGETTIGNLLPQSDGSLVLTGTTGSRFFPVTASALERCDGTLAPTLGTGFVARLSGDGSRILYGSYLNLSKAGSYLLQTAMGGDGRLVTVGRSAGYDLSYYGGPVSLAGPNEPPSQFLFQLDPNHAPAAARLCAVDAAGFGGALSNTGELITLFGTGIGPAAPLQGQSGPDGRYPVELGGTQVLANGQPAGLLYASADQINAWLPPLNRSGTSAAIQVMRGGQEVAATNSDVFGSAPALFRKYQTSLAAAINQDGSANGPFRPARAGARLTLFGTGFGETTPLEDGTLLADQPRPLAEPPKVFLNSVEVQVVFAGQAASGPPGLIQIDVIVPDLPGPSPYAVNFSVGSSFQLGLVNVWAGH